MANGFYNYGDNLIWVSDGKGNLLFVTDDPRVKEHRWHSNGKYVKSTKCGWAHRFVAECPEGEGLVTDHMNHKRWDNRKCNLRNVTPLTNSRNKESKNGGVYYNKIYQGWAFGVPVYCVYDTREEAEKEYKRWKRKNWERQDWDVPAPDPPEIPEELENDLMVERFQYGINGPTKVCTKCGIEKPLSEFGTDNRNRDGKQSRCRECDNKRKVKK